jgi:peptidoglycan/LPS O-acetylase OafA/YrhL
MTSGAIETQPRTAVESRVQTTGVGASHAQHIAGLDGLRGLGAFTVLFHHVGLIRHQGGWFSHAYPVGDFLFLLSGFVVGLAYEPSMAKGVSFGAFMQLRLGRLYPMILVGSLMGAAVGFFLDFHFSIWLALLAELIMVPFLVSSSEAYPLNNVQWTLFFELFANAVHVVAFPILSTWRLVGVVTLSALSLIVTVIHFHGIGVGFSLATFWGGFARVTFSYSAGLLVYRLYRVGRIPVIRVPYVAVAGVLFALLAMPATSWLPDLLVVIGIFPVLLLLAVQAPAPSGLFLKLTLWAGAISYPLYAMHLSMLKAAALLDPTALSAGFRAAFWILTMTAIVGAAWATEVMYDGPVRRWLRRRATKSRPRPDMPHGDSINADGRRS